MPASAPAAASRKVNKSTAQRVLGRRNVESAKKVTQPLANISASLSAGSAARTENAKKAVGGFVKKNLNNPFKPRKRK
jgi:hypothetical protein